MVSSEIAFIEVCVILIQRLYPDVILERDISLQNPDAFDMRAARRQIDIVGYLRNAPALLAEVKLYRSLSVPTDWLIRAAERLATLDNILGIEHIMLMVSARVSASQAETLRARSPRLEIIDFDGLYALAGPDEELIRRLDSILGVAVASGSAEAEPTQKLKLRERTEPTTTESSASEDLRITASFSQTRGQQLCHDLRQLKPGLKDATNFERAVQRALEYVFEGQLSGFRHQVYNDDDLRTDIAAKIIGKHNFWLELVRDFGARFVLFECKNYANKFTQEQVYTTEKYLYLPALRSVGIFVSRHGPDSGALIAMKGALRESRKLFLSITVDDLCQMLDARDDPGDVHAILAEQLDEMLLTISR